MEDKKSKESLFRQIFITQTHGFLDISKKIYFWKELADVTGGEFKVKHTVSRDLASLILKIPYKQYTIEFTESDTHPLKISCSMGAVQVFEFMISFEDTIDKLLKLLGQQDIEIGDEEFDKKYLITEKKTNFIGQILSDNQIKTILLTNNVFSFKCKYQKSDKTLQLSSLVSRTTNSKSELAELYKLFCLTIDKMRKLSLIE